MRLLCIALLRVFLYAASAYSISMERGYQQQQRRQQQQFYLQVGKNLGFKLPSMQLPPPPLVLARCHSQFSFIASSSMAERVALITGANSGIGYETMVWWRGPLVGALGALARTPAQGAATSLHLATAPEAGRVSGEYFTDPGVTSKLAGGDAVAAARLWQVSEELCEGF